MTKKYYIYQKTALKTNKSLEKGNKMTKSEKAIKLAEWVRELADLNKYINSLSTWDEYAERMQAKYDRLMAEDPRLQKYWNN